MALTRISLLSPTESYKRAVESELARREREPPEQLSNR